MRTELRDCNGLQVNPPHKTDISNFVKRMGAKDDLQYHCNDCMSKYLRLKRIFEKEYNRKLTKQEVIKFYEEHEIKKQETMKGIKQHLLEVQDHSEFAFLAENRQIITNKSAKAKLLESIEARGILQPVTTMPFDPSNADHLLEDGLPHLLAHPDDETELEDVSKVKYLVLDGAHRFVFGKEAGVPIPVIVNPELKREDIISMNNLATKWTTLNYINSYAKLNLGDYRLLQKEVNYWHAKGFSVTEIAIQFSDDKNNSASNLLKTRQYKFNRNKGVKVLSACHEFTRIEAIRESKVFRSRAFVSSISQIFNKYEDLFSAKDVVSYFIKNKVNISKNAKKDEIYTSLVKAFYDIHDQHSLNRPDARFYTDKQKQIIAKRDINKVGEVVCEHPRCSIQGEHLMAVDHMDPWNPAYPNTIIENGQLLCKRHNSEKGDMPYDEWQEKIHKKEM